ncbi:MAG: hypothetical protein WD648_09970, partial [Planctomycetaceae bacterium]
ESVGHPHFTRVNTPGEMRFRVGVGELVQNEPEADLETHCHFGSTCGPLHRVPPNWQMSQQDGYVATDLFD